MPGPDRQAVGRDGKAMRILFRSGLAAGLVGAAVLFVIVVVDDAGDRGAAGPSFLGVGEQADAPPANQQAARDRRQARAERRERAERVTRSRATRAR